ncbi:caspase-9 isoform X2 [Caloenas nicobarica]|uniref:caspase-9 isoform X2 n=1 Tax=Caloenas nicobarica TaxID=187106 RepID=UPI0032B755EE
MEEAQRRALRRGRARLVAALRVAPLWEPLEQRGLFTRPMVEELQSAGSRGDQARQLVIDLETRGKRAFPLFLSILRDTGQGDLADMLMEECGHLPTPPQLGDLRPVELDLRGEKHRKSVSFPEHLSVPVQAESERPQVPPTPAQGSAVDQRNCNLVYELKSDPCGCCLILNNINFSQDSDLSTRAGSDVDCKKLEKRFKALSFDVLTLQDLPAQEMVLELQKLARQDHSALDCCVVVILSHGCQTPAGNVDQPDAVASLPTPSDILVSYSTFPGFVSWREASSGSWYVETLDSVLEQYAHSEDLLNMLLRVANAVSAKGRYKQIPGCFNFLRKKFFFRCK